MVKIHQSDSKALKIGEDKEEEEECGLIPEQRLLIETTLKSDTVKLTAVSFCSST